MRPLSTPKASSSTFTSGARQLVVQLALETTFSSPVRISSLTPSTTMASTSLLAGALMTTWSAPASRCWEALS